MVCADEDAKELERLRKLLCLQQADIDELHGQTCGTLFKEVGPTAFLACQYQRGASAALEDAGWQPVTQRAAQALLPPLYCCYIVSSSTLAMLCNWPAPLANVGC